MTTKTTAKTSENFGSIIAEGLKTAQITVAERVDKLGQSFMTAFTLACKHGNAEVIYFDDPSASCFRESEDIPPVRRGLIKRFKPMFADNGKNLDLSVDPQDIIVPYVGERYTFVATISDMVVEDAEAKASAAEFAAED